MYRIIDAKGNQLGTDYSSIRGARTAKTILSKPGKRGKEAYETARIFDENGKDVDAKNPINAPEAE